MQSMDEYVPAHGQVRCTGTSRPFHLATGLLSDRNDTLSQYFDIHQADEDIREQEGRLELPHLTFNP